MKHDPISGKMYLTVYLDQIVTAASNEAMVGRVYEEVQKAIANDPDFRILVAEGVREAMAKMNIAEIVQAAVSQVLKDKEAK